MEKVDDPPYLTPEQAVNIVREHGINLESARGPVPSLASTAAGEQLLGASGTRVPVPSRASLPAF